MKGLAKFKRYLPLYLMFLPGALYLLINNYVPMAGLVVAIQEVQCPGRIIRKCVEWIKELQVPVRNTGCIRDHEKYDPVQCGIYFLKYSIGNHFCNLYL